MLHEKSRVYTHLFIHCVTSNIFFIVLLFLYLFIPSFFYGFEVFLVCVRQTLNTFMYARTRTRISSHLLTSGAVCLDQL